jgi:branched-chain amino acid transport system ATP-binding protein
VTAALLQARSISKNFGGLKAVDDVSLEVFSGRVHAVIGPNGAGKTTLINLLSGELPVSSGQVIFAGSDITRLPPERRARLGIGRSFQKTNIFPAFTTLENCRLAAQSLDPKPLRWLRDALSYGSTMNKALRALEITGLAPRAAEAAVALSHGEQRQLEIAVCLATEPRLLLLDEPLAGMGAEESARMVELICTLRDSHGILLVEHDMDAVFQVADVLTVMVDGKVLRSGPPHEVRADAAVQAAYLGMSGG